VTGWLTAAVGGCQASGADIAGAETLLELESSVALLQAQRHCCCSQRCMAQAQCTAAVCLPGVLPCRCAVTAIHRVGAPQQQLGQRTPVSTAACCTLGRLWTATSQPAAVVLVETAAVAAAAVRRSALRGDGSGSVVHQQAAHSCLCGLSVGLAIRIGTGQCV